VPGLHIPIAGGSRLEGVAEFSSERLDQSLDPSFVVLLDQLYSLPPVQRLKSSR
jgi:hypothetical protein